MAVSYGTYTITEVQEGSQIWTSSAAPTTPNYTFDISHLTGDSDVPVREGDIILNSYYRYTVLSISSDGTTVLTGNRTSIRGATGAASVTYTLIVSNLAIVKDKDGNLSPSTITVTAKSQTGSKAMTNYTGRIKIETTTNNLTWTSRINEDAATKTYTIPNDTVAIRCSLYLKGGTTTLLDQQTIPVVSDGIDGTNITITSTSVTYQKGTSGTVKPTGTWETDVQSVSVGQGEYLWTRTIVNYSDGSSTEAYSVSRNAVNGTNGTNGKDGKDGTSPTVSSTVTEYAQSTNGTTPPTSGWDTTPKTATAGQYMWTRVTVTYSDSATAVSYTVSKNGTNGTDGINTATVYLYKKDTTAPSVPSGNTTYTFSTKKLTGTLDSWTQEIPTTGSGQCYVIAAVASSNGTTDTIGTGEWSTPIQFNGTNGTNGTDGTNGLNQATIFLYKRGTSVTKPTTSVTYTFSTGKLSAEPNSWTRNIPTINGSPCWVVSATAIGSGTTATIAGSNWSDPIKLVEDGVDGKDAYSIVLTNENHTFAGNTTSAIASEIECNVIAYKGTTQIAATIGTITGQPTGMTTSLLNNGTVNAAFKVNVTTSMVTKSGVLTVPITVDGKSFTKEFTYTLTLDGEDGKDGGRWYSGTKITGTSTTATVFSGSGITLAVVGDMYLNTDTYNTYQCTLGGNASTAKWKYVNNIKGTTGKGISSITNQYYLSTSDTTQSGGSWSDTPQTYVEGRYYWTRSHIVWDDGGSPTNTTPVLDHALTDANANAIDAKKVATNYLSMDSTGIMVADMNDGEQKPSEATGRNVFIDNDSVDIRNGTSTLASFTGDNTKFYDPIYSKELAVFGTNGAIIGAENEQRFVIERDAIKSINDNGATVFSVNSTSGTVVTEAQVASGGESSYYPSSKTVVFDTVGTGFTTNITFYTKKLTAIIRIRNSAKPLTNVKVNSVAATSTLVDSYSGYWYSSTHSIDLSPFSFTYGTSKSATYQITASFVNDYGDSYNLTAHISIDYDGNVTLTVQALNGECVRTSGNNENIATMDLLGSKIIYDVIYQSSAYTKAPSMTFGTRGKDAIMSPFSVTIGEDLYANNDNQLSIGRYNLNNDEFFPLAFAIGNGSSDMDRSNAFSVDWDGNTIVEGDLTVNGDLLSSTAVTKITDCNDGIDPRKYYYLDSSGTNKPTTAWIYLRCFETSGNNVVQIASVMNTTDPYMYLRSRNSSGTWSSWKTFSMSGHKHAASDITSGTLPIANGGTGNTGTTYTETIADIITKGTNITISNARYAQWGKIAQISLALKTTAALSGNTVVATLVSGKCPKTFSGATVNYNGAGIIYTNGTIHVNQSYASGTILNVNATYILP